MNLAELLASQGASPEAALEASELKQRVKQALDRLSPRQRAAVVQHYFLEMDEKTVAAGLNAPIGTVKWLLSAARRTLRFLLASERNRL